MLLPRQRGLVIAITHYIANTGGFGKAKLSDGGNKIQYQADTRMEIAGSGMDTPAIKPWTTSDGERIGQIVNWKIICSSMGAPGGSVQSYIRYGKGIDSTQEVLILACDLGLISKGGAWFTCDFVVDCKDLIKEINKDANTEDNEALMKSYKFQGQDKIYNFLKENPKLVSFLEAQIKEML
jgi:hypothetical protein